MGYPSPLKASIRKIADNVVTVSCPFSILDRLDVGARMSLINCHGSIVAYSPIPYGDYVEEALKVLTDDKDATITHVVVVNCEHNLAAKTYKPVYPDVKFVASYNVKLGEECPVDYVLTEDLGNKVLDGGDFATLGWSGSWMNQVNIIFLLHHKNKDVVLYDKASKILFEGDVLFNIGACDENGCVEQYSPATGHPEKHFPFTGWSYLLRFVNPNYFLGTWFSSNVSKTKDPKSVEGLQLLLGLDFDVIVPCHGNVITKDAKAVLRDTLGLTNAETKSVL